MTRPATLSSLALRMRASGESTDPRKDGSLQLVHAEDFVERDDEDRQENVPENAAHNRKHSRPVGPRRGVSVADGDHGDEGVPDALRPPVRRQR